ncbi:MAG: T9SS type A sorting domain-containing protein [Ignavibacteria bacterium]|nr:T9SS type A sorting domain-containing protein [Ignavibacteria bacterium]
MRNISEDLAIQSNIKQGNIEEAISDYDEIYTSNTNTPKGFHALINKEILSAGAGDNLGSGNTFDEIEFKQIKINTLLKGLNAKDANANISTNSNPLSFDLLQNYPNPFNPRTIINYELGIRNFVMLKVYDIAGREVVTLVNEIMPAGKHAVEFNAADLSSGVYFYSLNVDGKQIGVKRMALVK